jgi:hypothetical protein
MDYEFTLVLEIDIKHTQQPARTEPVYSMTSLLSNYLLTQARLFLNGVTKGHLQGMIKLGFPRELIRAELLHDLVDL